MKKLLLSVFLITGTLFSVSAQNVNISGNITSDATWTNDNFYILTGLVRVQAPAVLTIEAGTVIKGVPGDPPGTLIIERGAQIIAVGTVNAPIIFTSAEDAGSRTPGDWGGIVLCGNGPVNTPSGEFTLEGNYGAVVGGGASPNAADNSGTLRYVRIEFAGYPIEPDKEINSLTMGAVGSGTTIEYVQVSYANDDAFEWFGGTVNAKYLVAYKTNDDIFDTDYGFAGKVQFGLGISDPDIADVSKANGFETDNDGSATNNQPWTNGVFSNITILGPKQNHSDVPGDADFGSGVHFKKNTRLHIFNSVIGGFPTGVLIDGAPVATNINNDELEFQNNVVFAANGATGTHPTNRTVLDAGNISPVVLDPVAWFTASNNTEYDNASELMLTNPYAVTPDARPTGTSPLLTGADFSHTKLDAFFTDVTYRGAFGETTDWTAGWTEWDPQNAVYSVTGTQKASKYVTSTKLYPNPVSDIAKVELELNTVSDVKITLTDMMGKEMKSINVSNTSSVQESFDVAGLAKGIYTINYYINGAPAKAELLMVK